MNSVAMKWRLRRFASFAYITFLLAGCAHQDAERPSHKLSEADSRQTEAAAPAPVSADDHLVRALNLLEQGAPGEAKLELKACLAEMPASRAAKFLLAQIEMPLSTLYPGDSFTVVLGKGDTLSGLAATYLGDPLAFYGLARYNDIAEPWRIMAGQRLRIPGTPTALAAKAERDTTTVAAATDAPDDAAPSPQIRSQDDVATFKNALHAGRFVAAAQVADASHLEARTIGSAVLADVYMRAAVDEKDDSPVSAGEHARKAGLLYLNVVKSAEQARAAFLLAVSAQSSDGAARAGLDDATNRLASEYYQRAILAFQRQDLEGAIAAWDKLLAIRPDDFDAQLNRAQALQLKANLQKLRG